MFSLVTKKVFICSEGDRAVEKVCNGGNFIFLNNRDLVSEMKKVEKKWSENLVRINKKS